MEPPICRLASSDSGDPAPAGDIPGIRGLGGLLPVVLRSVVYCYYSYYYCYYYNSYYYYCYC
jgi:hypothetical protein